MPKKKHYSYFKGYSDCTDCALWAANSLSRLIDSYSEEKAESTMNEIHGIEHESDTVKHRMIENLAKEFLPPIERDDIMTLMDELDNVVDGIDEVNRRICMFRIKEMREDMKRLSMELIDIIGALQDLIKEFEHFKKSKSIKEKIIRVNTLESEGDTLHFNAVSHLFAASGNPLEVMAWKEIYDCVEECFDACEHAADAVASIILSNT